MRADARRLKRAESVVFFWFIGTAVVTVWLVFRDPRFDYRLLIVGAVLPGIVDALLGGARVMHSLTFSVALPGATMRSRQSAALLTRLELPELIARDADDYVERAVALALDAPRRAAVREQLRARASRLTSDRDAVVAAIQDALLAR